MQAHTHAPSTAFSAPLAIASPTRAAGRARTSAAPAHANGAALTLLTRCDSAASIASLLFDMEIEDGVAEASTAQLPARLPSELEHFAELASGAGKLGQAGLWVDALEARALALASVTSPDEQQHQEAEVYDDSGIHDAEPQAVLSMQASLPAGAAAASQAHQDTEPGVLTWLMHNSTSSSTGKAFGRGPLRSAGSARIASSDSGAAADESAPLVDIRRFAQHLADMGRCVWVRSGLSTCPPESGMGTIRHKFVVVSMPGVDGQATYYVVDPNYLSHFQVSLGKGPEANEYKKMLAALPSVFVGTAEQLAALVTRICFEMEKVFAARGLALPPWRSPRVMQSRWLVNRVEQDEHVPATPPSTPLPLSLPDREQTGGDARMQQGQADSLGRQLSKCLPALAHY